jgi:hypothetical protein
MDTSWVRVNFVGYLDSTTWLPTRSYVDSSFVTDTSSLILQKSDTVWVKSQGYGDITGIYPGTGLSGGNTLTGDADFAVDSTSWPPTDFDVSLKLGWSDTTAILNYTKSQSAVAKIDSARALVLFQQFGDTSTWDATKTNLTAYQTTATGQADADTSTWDATKTWAQPAEATLTDIADGTIAENLVNTANPWADNEIASSATWNTVGLEVGRQVGSVFVSKTFTNIGTSFVDVYVTAFDAEDMMIIDFTNADSVSAVFIWDYIGAGKQYVQWVDVADNSKILLSSLEMNGDADATRIEWAALPAWFVNKKLTIEWQGKSLTAADDPVAKGYVLYLK